MIHDLCQNPGPINGVDGAKSQSLVGIRIVEQCLDNVLVDR